VISERARFEGRTVLITGAARGIGRCTAAEFARAGATLLLVDCDSSVDAVAHELGQSGAQAHAFTVDVADQKQVDALVRTVLERFGALDVLINNAGIGYTGELATTPLPTWRALLDVNLWGPLHLIYGFLPAMQQRRSGHFVNVASGQVFFRVPTWGAYATTKLALAGVSEIFHYELRKFNIQVTTVYPFLVNTQFYRGLEPKSLAGRLALRLMPHYAARPEEVARRIFDAVQRRKRSEMVSVINRFGFHMQLIPPLSGAISRVGAWLLGDPTQRFGFAIDEEMTGEHAFEPGFGPPGRRAMRFEVSWGTASIGQWLRPGSDGFLRGTLAGVVTIEGLCRDADCH
jgi:NAD(P)-dependent dehydrogenase (short-subunit alcohol dehydrogenase family)